MRKLSKFGRMLLLSFLASAFSGVALHITGHSTTHEYWHIWSAIHILTSLLFLVYAIRHIWMHRRGWHFNFLSILFLVLLLTGIILLAFIDGANSSVGMWHYRLGLVFIISTFVHVIRRIR